MTILKIYRQTRDRKLNCVAATDTNSKQAQFFCGLALKCITWTLQKTDDCLRSFTSNKKEPDALRKNMTNADYLLQKTEDIKRYCNESSFPDGDIRKDFHSLMYDLVYNYYWGYYTHQLCGHMGNKKVMFTEDIFIDKVHIDRLIELRKFEVLERSFLNSLNRNLILGAWTAFEISLTTIADAVLNEKEKEELFAYRSKDIIKIIKKEGISDEAIAKVRKKLTDKHLTHIPPKRKFDKIISHFGCTTEYVGDHSFDSKLIEFYTKLRNATIHSNGIYFGEDVEYDLTFAIFKFKNGETYTYSVDEELIPRTYITLVYNLSRIFIELSKFAKDIPEIKYPEIIAED